MKLTHFTAALTLAATVSLTTTVAPTFAQQQNQQQQQQEEGPGVVFAGDGLSFEIWGYDENTNEMAGYLKMGQNQFPFQATVDLNTGNITGRFAVAQGEAYNFNANITADGARVTFVTGGKTYNLVNQEVGQSQARQQPAAKNPLDQGVNTPQNNGPSNSGGAPAGNAVTPNLDDGFAALQAGDGQLAYQHLEPLAMQGDVDAARLLGVMFHYGKAGMNVDGVAAAKYYEIAAKQNDLQSLGNLGYLYRDGIGVAVDGQKASDFFRRAAMLGEVECQFAMGELHWFGELVEQDDAEAVAWWIVAAENGHNGASNNMVELRRTLDTELMAKAEARAKEIRGQIKQVMAINADVRNQRAVEDIRNLATGSKFNEIKEMFTD